MIAAEITRANDGIQKAAIPHVGENITMVTAVKSVFNLNKIFWEEELLLETEVLFELLINMYTSENHFLNACESYDQGAMCNK